VRETDNTRNSEIKSRRLQRSRVSNTILSIIFVSTVRNNRKVHGAFRVSGKLMAKQKVALECLSYHATASVDDTIKLAQDTIPSAETYNLYRWVTHVLVIWYNVYIYIYKRTSENSKTKDTSIKRIG